jgi:hypothetical protein
VCFAAVCCSSCGGGSAAAVAPSNPLDAVPPSLSFNGVPDDTNVNLPTLVTNNGSSSILITGVTVSGAGFSQSGISAGTVVTPGQSVQVMVTFAPVVAGAVSGAKLAIASNATNSPTVVELTGTGTHYVSLSWSPSPTQNVDYNVYRGNSSGGESDTPINPSPLSATAYTDSSVASGTDYFYYVEAIDSGVTSVRSNEAEAEVPSP